MGLNASWAGAWLSRGTVSVGSVVLGTGIAMAAVPGLLVNGLVSTAPTRLPSRLPASLLTAAVECWRSSGVTCSSAPSSTGPCSPSSPSTPSSSSTSSGSVGGPLEKGREHRSGGGAGLAGAAQDILVPFPLWRLHGLLFLYGWQVSWFLLSFIAVERLASPPLRPLPFCP